MPTMTAIHHVGLTVTDIEASIPWYMRVLGLTKLGEELHHPDGPGYVLILNHPAGFNVGLDHHPDNPGEPFSEHRTGLDHIGFHVANRAELEAWEIHLGELGVAHAPIVDKEWGSFLVFRDPDNIQLAFNTLA